MALQGNLVGVARTVGTALHRIDVAGPVFHSRVLTRVILRVRPPRHYNVASTLLHGVASLVDALCRLRLGLSDGLPRMLAPRVVPTYSPVADAAVDAGAISRPVRHKLPSEVASLRLVLVLGGTQVIAPFGGVAAVVAPVVARAVLLVSGT